MPFLICVKCGRELRYEGETPRFCFGCGEPLNSGDALQKKLRLALQDSDSAGRYQKLCALRNEYPSEYAVEFEILVLGRLYERGGKPDFSRIPYWPLIAFETPGQFSEKEREKMLRSFFENEEVYRVSNLAPDKGAFFREYYFRMASGYVEMVLKGNAQNTTFFGFPRKASEVTKRCANALSRMLANLKKAAYPEEQTKEILIDAFKRAFLDAFGEKDARSYVEKM